MTQVAAPTIFTIGHSTHSLPRFVELLRMHGVTAVADIRSSPHSRVRPEFSREPLRKALRANGIEYVFLGRELGARSKDQACYEDGRVQYRKIAETDLFRSGLKRVLDGSRTYRIALLCAEREPLACHRTLLVARELEVLGETVQHIHADGHLESQTAALERLLVMLGMDHHDMFWSPQQLIEEAYARQEQRIAYVNEDLRAVAHGATK